MNVFLNNENIVRNITGLIKKKSMKNLNKNIIGIYKITNPKGKTYIGQSINIERRFKEYKTIQCKQQPKIYYSLKKYGPENHIFEIIEECNLEQLNEKELYWKLYYNCIIEGLNCELYDNGIGPRSEETKQKISLALQNHHLHYTEDIIQKMKKPKPKGFGEKISKALTGKPNQMKGKTQKFKGRVSPNKNNKYKHSLESCAKKHKPILQYNLKENFIKEWSSIKEAKMYTKINNIPLALSGANKTAGKFIWRYKI
jgi:group I intron endonuclease